MSGPHPLRTLVRRVYDRSADDNVLFLASGVTFGVVLAAIPFLLLVLSLPSFVLGGGGAPFREETLRWLWRIIPVTAPQVQRELAEQLRPITESAGSIGLISAVAFAWFSTRLFGSLRTALDEVFDIEDPRGVLEGKWWDLQLVLASTVLLSANIAATAFLGVWGPDWPEVLGFGGRLLRRLIAFLTPFVTIYAMFFLIYRFLPAKRITARTAAVSSLFAALGFEAVKYAFSWFVANYADYTSIFFGFTVIVLLVLSVYYTSLLFVIGGEVGQAFHLQRIMQRQREILD